LTLWYTHQRQELDRDANRTDRYTKAVEQLGDDDKPAVQLGGVYALERVAQDSPRDRPVAIEVLAAFVRQHVAKRAGDRGSAGRETDTTSAAALTGEDNAESRGQRPALSFAGRALVPRPGPSECVCR
jgi:hypothetical protein